ncbi:uncharacterized protein LOC112590476 [Harpegnathos saltator]|uniref:uncharacterized protein LOC112590476 n=1 Tax=Harpegnathos saltator TaxID=610380 RepID=UPI00058DBDEA|nr:uncharacterized protein LOC112590476 [Harpegnathos saltator]
MVLSMTVQYRHMATKLALIFREGASWNKEDPCHGEVFFRDECVDGEGVENVVSAPQHRDPVLEVDFMLGLSITLFLFVGVLQFYILCSSVQKLSDVNTEMTNMAFHENWYQFTPSIKRVFLLMALSNNLGCEITMCEKLRLSLPSFMSVLNEAYSVALILLKMK